MKDKEYIRAMNSINISNEMKERVLAKSIKVNHEIKNENENKKEKYNMKFKRKIAVILAAAAMILGVTAFASSGVISSWRSGSSAIPDYKALPTAEDCIKDVGYSPVLIQSFENGYEYESGSIVKNDLQDESGNSVEKFKSLNFRYKKDNDRVSLSAQKYLSETESHGDVIANINGTDIYYTGYTNKLVPGNYELTEEDKIAEESGELVFSYGMDEVSIVQVQGLSWSIDDVQYNFTQIDGELSKEDLVEMAKEIIDQTE